MPTHQSLPPEVATLLRELTTEWRDQRSERAENAATLAELKEETIGLRSDLAHAQADLTKIKKYVFEGNGTPSVLARLTHLEGVLSKAWALALGLITTGAGGILAYYLGTK